MRATLLLAACLVLPACASYAGDGGLHDAYSREGAYVSAAAVTGIEMFGQAPPFESADNSDLGFSARVGYRGKNGCAIELFAEDVDGYALNASFDSTEMEFQSIGLNGKVFFTEGRVQPYGLLGVGWTRILFSERELTDPTTFEVFKAPNANDVLLVRGGLGVDVYVTDSIAFFLEGSYNYQMSQPGTDLRVNDFGHIQALLGITYRF